MSLDENLLFGVGGSYLSSVTRLMTWGETVESEKHLVEHGSRKRRYRVYIPDSVSDAESTRSVPLLLVLHGAFGTPEMIERKTRFDALAEEEGIIVVYPKAINRRWNIECEEPDDADFLSSLIDEVVTEHPIDPRSIYVAGFSNGGMMSHRLALEVPRVRAIATVAGSMPVSVADEYSEVESGSGVPTLVMHGRKDPVIRWDGSDRLGMPELLSVPRTVDFWKEWNGVNSDSTSQTVSRNGGQTNDEDRVRRSVYDSSDADVEFYEIVGGGHTWPGSSQFLPKSMVGETSNFDATSAIWEFFERS